MYSSLHLKYTAKKSVKDVLTKQINELAGACITIVIFLLQHEFILYWHFRVIHMIYRN